MPVDRAFRDKLADAAASFMRGEIKSYDLDYALLEKSSKTDPDANIVGRQLWLFYDDIVDHPICQPPEGWECLRRWIAFLKTDYALVARPFEVIPRPLGPWILLLIFLVSCSSGWLTGHGMLGFFVSWPVLGIFLDIIVRDTEDQIQAAHFSSREIETINAFAPFLSQEDWLRHERLLSPLALPAYDPAVHYVPFRTPRQQTGTNLHRTLGHIVGFPLLAALSSFELHWKITLYQRRESECESPLR